MSEKVTFQPMKQDVSLCTDDIPLVTAQAMLPHFDGKNGRFNRYYRAFAHQFDRFCRQELFPRAEAAYYRSREDAGPIPQWRAEVKSTVTYEKDGILSLYCDTIVTGMPQRYMARQGDTWDMGRQLFLQLSDCFPPKAPWKRLLLEHAEKVMEMQEKEGIARYHDNWRYEIGKVFRAHRFYLGEDGLYFFFPFASVAPAVEGIPTFCLPYDQERGPFVPFL